MDARVEYFELLAKAYRLRAQGTRMVAEADEMIASAESYMALALRIEDEEAKEGDGGGRVTHLLTAWIDWLTRWLFALATGSLRFAGSLVGAD